MSNNKEKIGWTEDDVTNAKKNRWAVKEFHKTWFSGQQQKKKKKKKKIGDVMTNKMATEEKGAKQVNQEEKG